MKKITAILAILTLHSCLMPGAPHGHLAESIENTTIKVRIPCQPNNKYYTVTGVEKTDSVYISSRKMKMQDHLLVDKNFLCLGDSIKSYRLRIGDHNFHRKLLNDTIEVKVVKQDASVQVYHFLVVKDSYIRN